MSLRIRALAAALLLLPPLQPAAAPHVPADDARVLERLPGRPTDPAQRELRRLREELRQDPGDLATALKLADRYYGRALGEGDPRYIGYAQAALRPWWDAADAPVQALVMRATLRQYLHDFPAAIADLDRALARDPRNEAALFQRAVIRMVQADYAASRRDCEAMRGVASDLIATACEATADALSGKAVPAYARLATALEATPAPTRTERLWVQTRLGEMAERLGRAAEADRHYRAALAVGIDDAYLLATYAEFLLDQARAKEVVELLRGRERSDVLLVRLALAEKAAGLPEAKEHAAAIQARFDAGRMRGDKLHLQDEARFALQFLGRPQEALALARENYETQREPSDVRMLMESALAARDRRAAQPALDWLAASANEDVQIRRLAGELEQLPR